MGLLGRSGSIVPMLDLASDRLAAHDDRESSPSAHLEIRRSFPADPPSVPIAIPLSPLPVTAQALPSASTMSSSYFSTPNYRREQGKLVDFADKAIHGAKEVLVSHSWGPIVVLGAFLELPTRSWAPLTASAPHRSPNDDHLADGTARAGPAARRDPRGDRKSVV